MKNRFLSVLILLSAGAAAALRAGESYNFTFFSDTHFADAESYSHDPADKYRFPAHKKDPHRPEKALPLYRTMFARMAADSNSGSRFAICGGDFIDGFARSPEVHAEQLRKYLDFTTRTLPGPLYVINGNHDMFSRGGADAYNRVMLPYLEKLTGRKLTHTDYTLRVGNDLFIFMDYFGRPKQERLNFALDTLRQLTWKPRYVFLVTHAPILPAGSPRLDAALVELGKFNSVILSGHRHRMQLLECRTPQGPVVQLGVGSYLQIPEAKNVLKAPCDGTEALGGDPITTPFPLTRMWRCRGQGYALIAVSDAGVEAIIRSAAAKSPEYRLKLR